jgi:hypothetical protein
MDKKIRSYQIVICKGDETQGLISLVRLNSVSPPDFNREINSVAAKSVPNQPPI